MGNNEIKFQFTILLKRETPHNEFKEGEEVVIVNVPNKL